MVKRALCVGLNYPEKPHQLFGCVNDCLNWAGLLEKDLGFDECRILIDQNPDGSLATARTQVPTKANILSQFGDWLCASTKPGDVATFVFAGHGAQVKVSDTEVEEALIPKDFDELDRHGNPPVITEGDIHSLLAGLPSGSFVTLVLDASHVAHMLDVPCSVDSSNKPHRVNHSVDRPTEVRMRNEHSWKKSTHAYARPRFVPAVVMRGVRQKPPGVGAHAGRMTLDPGVTAFSFAAARCHESALDCSIKSHQQGVMSFCLQEALLQLNYRCTYAQLLTKASEVADDIREKYMPSMDQHFHLSFCPNSAPSEAVFLDARYSGLAEHKMRQNSKNRERGSLAMADLPTYDRQHPLQDVDTDFVPAPTLSNRMQADGSSRGKPPSQGHTNGRGNHPPPPTAAVQAASGNRFGKSPQNQSPWNGTAPHGAPPAVAPPPAAMRPLPSNPAGYAAAPGRAGMGMPYLHAHDRRR
mmetsp:Transcript_31926/g.74742  ORF Transcript_31926/g.74742 Transcript_31926/m.74742 type:complete len:469 (+) Transcript_31926:105-1511(+)|eukprot:CAMPEP_0178438552 /NCGR_PEP_ID=MMETSP0689_2-20121128/35653_1 /TAXON_ID=160604 /ORGANISM="Amphidinium massartii, Strain CS-259" /LENGTH=468 /DNA_ID=CAMNT_0020060961 /DNA_START=18 /DNA_END=1424 /DNA_ORIENTATION=+